MAKKFNYKKASALKDFFSRGIKIMKKRGMVRGQGFTPFPKRKK